MAGFADLFGGMFGGGGPAPTPGLLDAAGYMDPAQYDAARRSQGMMGLWAGLLQGGGPSLEPRNFGSALGAGLVGQQKFGSTFDEDQLHASQAAAQRANVGKLGAEAEAQRAAIKLLGQADQIPTGMLPPGAAPVTGDVPNFGAGTGGGGGGWGPHAPVAIETLKAAGYSDAAIAGIMANGLGEGGFKTNWQKAGGGENSFGHWQFNERGELPGLREFARAQGGDPTDTRIQALYVAKRAEEVSPGFSKLTDPKLATDIFATKFERYKGAAPGQRYGFLADATRYMAGTPVEERLPIPAGPGGYAGPVPGGAIPEFAGGRAGALGGPVPAVVAEGPAAPVPGPLAAPAPPQEVGGGLAYRPGGRNWTPPVPVRGNAGGGGPPMLPPDADYGGGGDAGEGGPSLAPGGVFSPAAQAIAAGAPPVPAAAVGPAPPIPPAPPAAAAPAPAVLARPPTALPAPPAPLVATAPPMPGAAAAPPLPAAQAPPAGGAQPYNPQAHRAQMIAQALTLMGKTVPAHIAEAAGLPLAGQKAAQEAAARQPYELQRAQQQQAAAAALKQWEGLNKSEQDRIAAANDLTKEQFKKQLEVAAEPDIAGARQQAQADNTQTTMVIGNRRVPMTVGQANRISRGESPETVLGPNVLQLGETYQTPEQVARGQASAEYNKEIMTGFGKQDIALRAKADGAREAISSLEDTREQLRGAGIFTGYGANTKLTLAQVAAAAGWPNEKIVNSQTYLIQAGKQAAALLSSGIYGTGSGISAADLKAAERLSGGDLTLDIGTINRILDLAEKGGRRTIESFNDRIASHPDAARMAIPMPPRLVGTTADGGRVYQFPDGTRQVRN